MKSQTHPKLLISYSWDSEGHKNWVRAIAERIRFNGVDVKLDQWHVVPGQSLTQFMESEIVNCDFVLIICTPNYFKKSLSREGGVGYEQQIISGHIAAGVAREKFIPLLREGDFEPGDTCAIPPHFSGIFAIDMRSDELVDENIELLLRTIFGQPLHPIPNIGSIPSWGSMDEKNNNIPEVRLATIDLDGWELISGLAQHHRSPESFYIPPEEVRRSLNEGDTVKVMFEIAVPSDSNDQEKTGTFVERMWVLVKGRIGPYYIGELNSFSLTASVGEQNSLLPGDDVVFLPEHVIQIYEI